MKRARLMGYLRAAVGVALIAAPKATMKLLQAEESSDGFAMLIRTVGIRDLVLGVGTIRATYASAHEARPWILAGLTSDSLDVMAGAALSRRDFKAGMLSALMPLPFIAGDLQALSEAS
jgi:hypothetical protein